MVEVMGAKQKWSLPMCKEELLQGCKEADEVTTVLTCLRLSNSLQPTAFTLCTLQSVGAID